MSQQIQPVMTPEAAAKLQRALGEFGKAYLAWARRVAKAIAPPLAKMHAAMWKVYRERGMPYGETEEGLQRWMREEGRRRSQMQF